MSPKSTIGSNYVKRELSLYAANEEKFLIIFFDADAAAYLHNLINQFFLLFLSSLRLVVARSFDG